MSDDSPFPRQGAFIPFPKPIPAITTDPTSSPDFELCLHIDWEPAVLGALKALTRPESWSGSQADIDASVHGAYQLIASIVEPCNCGAPGLPFACAGDATLTSAPYGTWNCPTWGTYLAGQGWRGNDAPYSGDTWHGVEMFIDLGVPVNCRHAQLVYDMLVGGSVDPSRQAVYLYDLDHGSYLAGPILFSGLVSGTNLSLNFAGVRNGLQHIKVECFSDIQPDSLPGTGVCTVTAVRIDGYTVPPNPGPC